MKKNILVLILVLLSSFGVFSQKVRTTPVFDADTTTRPKSGFIGLGFRNGRLFAVPFSGTTYRIINANTHVGTNGQVLSSNGTNNFFKTLGLSDVGITGLSNSQLLATDITGKLQTLSTSTYPSLTEVSYLKGVTSAIQTQINSKFNTPIGLTTNYLPKWNGTGFVNSTVFESSGNVGIGTANPQNKIHLNSGSMQIGSISTSAITYSTRQNSLIFNRTDLPTTFTNTISNSWSGTPSDQTMNFELANGASTKINVLTLNGAGNVGIGTSSPSARLHVDGGGVFTGNQPLLDGLTGMHLGTSSGFPWIGWRNNSAALDQKSWDLYANNSSLIGRLINDANTVASAWLEVNRSSSNVSSVNFPNGNVGIGTSSPSAKLDVNGYSRFLSVDVRSSNFLLFYNSDNSNFSGFRNSGATGANNDNLDFFVAGGTRMRINNSGRLGIGTITPDASALLHVSSTTQGVLITRGTTTQINAIASPANGLMVYNTTLNKLCVYENGTWKQVTTINM